MGYPGIPPVQQYAQPASPPPTSDERNMAMLCHVLMIFTGFIAPLIIYLVKRDSKFVRFHSLMALFWQLIVLAISMIWVVALLATMFGSIMQQAQHPTPSGSMPPMPFLTLFPIMWTGSMFFWIINVILGIVFGIKAHDGKWDGYPLIKGWAAKAAGV